MLTWVAEFDDAALDLFAETCGRLSPITSIARAALCTP